MKLENDFSVRKSDTATDEFSKQDASNERNNSDFIEKHDFFRAWAIKHLNNLYEQDDFSRETFVMDPVLDMAKKLFPSKSGDLSSEQADLVKIFSEELLEFSSKLIFRADFDSNKSKIFYRRLYNLYFNRSPDVLNYLKISHSQKIALFSKIDEIYGLRNCIDISGETSYDMSDLDDEHYQDIIAEIDELSTPDKISVIKHFSDSATRAFFDGPWARLAYKRLAGILEQTKKNNSNPLVKFISDFELNKIQKINVDLDEKGSSTQAKENQDYELPKNPHFLKLQESIQKESDLFFEENNLVARLDNVLYFRASKDYGSIVLEDSFTPVALVKVAEISTKEKNKKENTLSTEEQKLHKFLREISPDSKFNNIEELIYVLSAMDEMQINIYELFPDINKKTAKSIFELYRNRQKYISEYDNIYDEVTKDAENKNLQKTEILFDFVNKFEDEIFSQNLSYLKDDWIEAKKDQYQDGMFQVVSNIASFKRFAQKDQINISQKALELVSMYQDVRDFDALSLDLVDRKVEEASEKIREKIQSISESLNEKLRAIDHNAIANRMRQLVRENFDAINKVQIINYDGITTDKSINPFGDEDFSQLIKVLHAPEFRDYLNNRLKINIENLSLREQIQFLRFISDSDEENFHKLENLFAIRNQTEGQDLLRSFLSMSGDSSMGSKILVLGEKLPKDSASKLFDTYSRMVDATEEVGIILSENLKEKATPELVNQTKESLLLAGKELLEKYSRQSEACEGAECENLGEQLKERLELAKSSVFAFSYACKTLVERGEFSFEDFKKAKLAYDRTPLPEEMKEKILIMHRENTKQYPEKLRDKWRGTLKDGIEKENPKQMVVSVSYGDEVVSAMRVIEQDDGSWYGASFNVNPTVQGSRIGTELLKKVLQDLAKQKPFKAHVYSKNPMLNTYTEKFGFKITKEIPNYEDTGETVYEITLAQKE